MSLPFPVYDIGAGSAFERGVQHGLKAREQIAATVETYRQIFRDFVRIDWEEAKRIGESYAIPIGRFDAEIADEIRGVAEGSGFDHAEILALNSRSEIALSARFVDGCTAFSAFGRATRDETTVLAQNWDWRPSLSESMVVLRIEQPGKPSLTMLTEAGIVGKLGFNSAGLGVCLNAIVTDRLEHGGYAASCGVAGDSRLANAGGRDRSGARAGIACAANFLVAQHGNGSIDIEAVPGELDGCCRSVTSSRTRTTCRACVLQASGIWARRRSRTRMCAWPASGGFSTSAAG